MTSTSTPNLIAALSQDLTPVHHIASPGWRLIGWLAVALPVSLVMGALVEQQSFALLAGEREPFELAMTRLTTGRSLLELGAILLTALTAAYAALCCVQPGRSDKAWMLPVLPFMAWLGLMGQNCLVLFQQIGYAQFSFVPHWTCYPSVVATGAAPAVVMVMLLRRGMVTTPTVTVVLAVLAASALGAVGLRLFHPPDATVMLLMWQFVATVTFLVAGALVSAYLSRR